MYKCINLKIRQKKQKKYLFCYKLKKETTFNVCNNCNDFMIVANKPIKKVSKNRITVKKEIYQQVYERDKGICRLQNGTCEGGLELHHIVYRSEDKKLINEPTNCIMLCTKHHQEVHSNKHYWQPKLKEMIKNEHR